MKTELLCIGNAIVDVFAAADPAWLDRAEIREPVQHIERDRAASILNELDTSGAAAVSVAGGGAANVAKIAALLGMETAFAGSVGSDGLAAVFENGLREVGVSPLLKKGAGKTGLCFVFESGGETRIAASPGAALEFSAGDVNEELFGGIEAVVLDGFMLERRPLVRRVLQLANKSGIPVALDVASVFHIKNKTEEILHYCRNYPLMVFMNADEAIVFYNNIAKKKDDGLARTEREKEALILKEICPVLKYITEGEIFPIIVIKLGGRGAVALAGGNVYRAGTFTVRAKNSVGAGDAFCAAFLAAWVRGRSIAQCAATGNKAARKILMVPGTRIDAGKLKGLARGLRRR